MNPLTSLSRLQRWFGRKPQFTYGLWALALISGAHIVEHVCQLFQIYALHMPKPSALGFLGMVYPWLVQSEWLHYGYAFVMLCGIWLLCRGFHGKARQWWTLALWVQVWHWFEHATLLTQTFTGAWFGESVPTSWLQELLNLTVGRGYRPELHMTYTLIVLGLMVVAMRYYLRPRQYRVVRPVRPSLALHRPLVTYFRPSAAPRVDAGLQAAAALALQGPNGAEVATALKSYRVMIGGESIGANFSGALAETDHMARKIHIPMYIQPATRSTAFLAALIAHESAHIAGPYSTRTAPCVTGQIECEQYAIRAGGKFWLWANNNVLPPFDPSDHFAASVDAAARYALGNRCYTDTCDPF